MLTYKAATPGHLEEVALAILEHFSEHRVFAFYGAMGAGKTTLIKYICAKLAVEDIAVSPTFALINEYRMPNDQPVYHFDFYRINSVSEAYDMGYEEYFYSGNYCFIEWPEKIGQLLPPGCVYINIGFGANGQTRIIRVGD